MPNLVRNGWKVLLLGAQRTWDYSLLAALKRWGCESSFATTPGSASKLFGEQEFDLVLSETRLSDSDGKNLLPRLAGSRASVFFFCPVEKSCWWLPILRRGKDCYGSPALRPVEFAAELKSILRESRPKVSEVSSADDRSTCTGLARRRMR
jgi:DNA-binding response OmpR family regulator